MNKLNDILSILNVSKVDIAKYLGVSRQMIYNYISLPSLDDWPKEKAESLKELLGLETTEDFNKLNPKESIKGEYKEEILKRLNDQLLKLTNRQMVTSLKGFNKREKNLLVNIIAEIKEQFSNDKNPGSTFTYLYNFLKEMRINEELKYVLAYYAKATGDIDPLEFVYDENEQYIFESILYFAISLYQNGNASKAKLTESHKRFETSIKEKKENAISRTQELNVAQFKALKELGYDDITEDNAKEVYDKIAEILSRVSL